MDDYHLDERKIFKELHIEIYFNDFLEFQGLSYLGRK